MDNIDKEMIFLYLFFVGATLALINSHFLKDSITIILQYAFAIFVQYSVLRVFFKYNYHSDYKLKVETLLKMYTVSFFIACLVGIAIYLGLFPHSDMYYSGNGRLNSIRGNANSLAKYIVISLPLILAYFDYKKNNVLLCVVLFTAVVNLILTASFGGLLYTGLVIIYYYLLKIIYTPSKSTGKQLLVFLCFALICVSYIYVNPPEVVAERILSINDVSQAGSYNLKVALMKESLEMNSISSLLVGIGPGSYPYVSIYGTNVHNLYLLIMSEFGFLSLLGFLLFLFSVYIKSLKNLKIVDKNFKIVIIGLNSSLLAFCMTLTTNTHTYTRSLWFFVVALWVINKSINEKSLGKRM
ncbi:O-antigen ligase family protein [Priestia koreensis]|uniref:O-antigen ligase family protein n=1 Tax=Priestia koreensis TaxID=284581 RepID=UPI001F580078|nr:O-antigen ligase family protein [Priestia koreensis]UNL85797.1 hypothetical protein IE339_04595 [Priestia koreensis]